MTTGILAIVCIILIFVLYVVSGGWKKYGGLRGMVKWLKSGATLNGGRSLSEQNASASARSQDEMQRVITVLEEIYADFDSRYQKLQQRLDRIEQEQARFCEQFAPGRSSTTGSDEPSESHRLDQPEPVSEDAVLRAVRLIQRTEAATVQPSAQIDADVSDEQTKYFEILDLLEAGVEPREITARLGVLEADVSRVAQLMQVPDHAEKSQEK